MSLRALDLKTDNGDARGRSFRLETEHERCIGEARQGDD